MSVRPYRVSDLSRLLAVNEASVPGVGQESMDSLATWIALSTCLVAVDEADIALGFITLMELGQRSYDSPNMRWFEDYSERTGRSLIYVDRIAIASEARGQGLGETLYRAAFERFQSHEEMGCEVNTLPPNPGSHRFHKRLGFRSVGETTYVPGKKVVMFYARALG